MATIVIVVLLGLAFVYAIYSSIKRNKQGCCSPVDTQETIQASDSNASNYTHTYQFEVADMHCNNCYTKVENAFNQEDDMMAKVNRSKKIVTIYTKEEVPQARLKQIIARAGYTPSEVIG